MRLLLSLLIVSSCVGCDQATKYAARQSLQHAPPVSLFGDTVHLGYALNPGGFLGLGASLPDAWRQAAFLGLNSLMMAAIVGYLWRQKSVPRSSSVALLLILSGGIGNLIDRASNGGLVTDFIVLRCGPLRTGVFNVADVAVTAGVLWLLVEMLMQAPPPSRDTPPA